MIYPIQTGTVRVKQFQLTGAKNNLSRLYQLLLTKRWGEWMPIYSWLIESEGQLILVDMGETARIYEEGYLPSGGPYHKAVQTKIKKEEEIPTQLKTLGYKPEDICTVILTHLHGDHIGGLEYFQNAHIYVSHAEYEVATSKKGPKAGYFKKNWPDWFAPQLIQYDDRAEGRFRQSYRLPDHENIIIVPTPGHSVGHQSVIYREGGSSYFIGGDLTYNLDTLKAEIPNVLMFNQDAQDSVRKALDYVRSHSCVFLSSHDWSAPNMLKANGE